MTRLLLRSRAGPFASTLVIPLVAVVLSGCSENPTSAGAPPGQDGCVVSQDLLFDTGIGRDAIPALTDPPLVAPNSPAAAYVDGDDRVAGLILDGTPMAFPHKLLQFHEAVNLNAGDERLVLTYCPLTGSAVIYRRGVIGGAEFGVTGLLFGSNLVLYDRTAGLEGGGERTSVWSQMGALALCGPRAGESLEPYPMMDMPLEAWKSLHPETLVASEETGFSRPYHQDHFAEYNQPANPQTGSGVEEEELDSRRLPKERVLGIPTGDRGGVAYPFFALDSAGMTQAIHDEVDGDPVVVFWDGDLETAYAFHSTLDGLPVEFQVQEGGIVDMETESLWRVDGKAVEGPRAGESLEPVARAFVAFWFAWAWFRPDIRIWIPDPGP